MTQTQTAVQALGPSISCFPSGNQFFLHSPVFNIEDIAHALSMQCRWNGMIRHFYSVAEHSVIVSLLMQELKLGDPMEGFLHDAHEAYVGDMVSPWKPEVPGWKEFEHRVESAMRDYFCLPTSITYGCKQADHIARHIEAYYLKQSRKVGSDPLGVEPIAARLIQNGWRTMNLYPPEAEQAFTKRWHELRG